METLVAIVESLGHRLALERHTIDIATKVRVIDTIVLANEGRQMDAVYRSIIKGGLAKIFEVTSSMKVGLRNEAIIVVALNSRRVNGRVPGISCIR